MKSQISSTETETEDEDMMPDLDRRSAVGAIEEEETLATSSDSLASLIPPEKKQSMQMFEETLKGMIQEARQMVKREDRESGDEVDAKDLEVAVAADQDKILRSTYIATYFDLNLFIADY